MLFTIPPDLPGVVAPPPSPTETPGEPLFAAILQGAQALQLPEQKGNILPAAASIEHSQRALQSMIRDSLPSTPVNYVESTPKPVDTGVNSAPTQPIGTPLPVRDHGLPTHGHRNVLDSAIESRVVADRIIPANVSNSHTRPAEGRTEVAVEARPTAVDRTPVTVSNEQTNLINAQRHAGSTSVQATLPGVFALPTSPNSQRSALQNVSVVMPENVNNASANQRAQASNRPLEFPPLQTSTVQSQESPPAIRRAAQSGVSATAEPSLAAVPAAGAPLQLRRDLVQRSAQHVPIDSVSDVDTRTHSLDSTVNTHSAARSIDGRGTTALSLPASPTSPEWSGVFSDKVLQLVKADARNAELRIDPPHLGRVEVRIDIGAERTSINFVADNAIVRDAIDQSSARLREQLTNAGFDNVSVDVSNRETRDGGNSRHPNGQLAGGVDPALDATQEEEREVSDSGFTTQDPEFARDRAINLYA